MLFKSKFRSEIYDLYVNFDGSCWPNPGGPAGWAFIIKNNRHETVLASSGVIPAGRTSNNVAEYVAARMALEAIREIASDGWRVLLRGDSQIVIGKLKHPGRVSKGLCRDDCIKAQKAYMKASEHGIKVNLKWVPREQNTEADSLT